MIGLNFAPAVAFAMKAHEGQKRKYTGFPYITHSIEVALILAQIGASEEQIIAGLLHDVIEDTSITVSEIENEFGIIVACFVEGMTDTTVLADGNRAVRKALDLVRLASEHAHVKTIKLADIISNTKDIEQHDPAFAKTYLTEINELLNYLSEGASVLHNIACNQVGHWE